MKKLLTIVIAISACASFTAAQEERDNRGNASAAPAEHHSENDALLQKAHLPLIHVPVADNTQPSGYVPAQIRHAYGVDQIVNQGDGQVIATVDAFDYPEAESDLAVFSTQFGLPQCTKASGCFTVVYSNGMKPKKNAGWTGETSLDLQWAHAIAPNARLLLVETPNDNIKTLLEGVPVAVANGATTVNMSWGTNDEPAKETQYDKFFFSNPSATYFNASGDNGNNLFGYPGASSLVVGAGGTTLHLDSNNNIKSETAWSGSGGGESKFFTEPEYQLAFQNSGKRGVPDVAWDADPNTGVAVYDTEEGQWGEVGGTSAASPQWCGLTAIANSLRAQMGKGPIGVGFFDAIYASPLSFHDITMGSNGRCGTVCDAGPGYDFVTGLGSPIAPMVVDALVAAP